LLELDGLRGIAALSVLLMHYTGNYDLLFGHTVPPAFIHPYGGHGVQLFFIISGFVILMTLDRSKTVLDFAVSRFARLYPVYWVAILLTFLVVAAFGLTRNTVQDPLVALTNVTMIQGFLGYPDVDPVYWTLQVELQFYVLMGVLVALRLRRWIHWIMASLVVIDIVDFFLQLGELRGWGLWRLQVYLPLRHLYLFLTGIVFYEMRSGWRWRYLPLLAVCAAGLLCRTTSPSTWIIAGLGLLGFVATQFRVPVLSIRVLVFLGTISYSLYLIHQNVGYIVIRLAEERGLHPNLAIALAAVVALTLATALTFLVERSSNNAIRNLYRSLKARRLRPAPRPLTEVSA
jgi:peptidoglycan/LPS O-acetylase OafA/YrhL